MTEQTEIDLLLEFLNTVDVETGEDELPDDAAWTTWLSEHGVDSPAGSDAAGARAVRDALRAAAAGEAATADPLSSVPVHVTLDRDGRPALSAPDPLGRLLTTAVTLVAEGRWARVKLCDAHTCRYAFYDGSRNHSGRWCSMAVCGNREKTRAFRARQRG